MKESQTTPYIQPLLSSAILRLLFEFGPKTLGQLRKWLCISEKHLSPILSRMKFRGMIVNELSTWRLP